MIDGPAPRSLETEVSLRWSDQGRHGHVNNAAVVILIEARVIAMKQLAASAPEGHDPSVPRVRVGCEQPVHYGHKLDPKVWIGRMGCSSHTARHELVHNGRRCVQADAVIMQRNSSATSSKLLSLHRRALLEQVLLPKTAEPDESETYHP